MYAASQITILRIGRTVEKRGQNSVKKIEDDIVLGCVKLLDLILVTLPFAICWFSYYAEKIFTPFYRRGNWLIVAAFFVLYVLFSHIYDALLISFNQISELVYSQVLSILFADGVMFIVLCLLTRAFPNILPALAALVGQVGFAVLWSVFADKWYFSVFPAKPSAVIYNIRHGLERLVRDYGLDRKFDIQITASVEECLNDLHMLDAMDTVFLSDICSHDRNIFLKYCIDKGISVYVIPRVGDTLMSSAHRIHMFHLPILRVERYNPSLAFRLMKRMIDVAFSAAAILALSPIMLITAIAVKVSDGGPVLYRQLRLTQGGKQFYMPKFRSMRVDAEKDGVARLSTGDSDDRITSVGRIIRKVRIDELPQLFSILFGTMSIVGPRPERPEIAAQYEEEMPEFALRLQAKAGLTGYAQVYGKYNTTPYDKLQMDLMYIAHPSILEDFRIIFATVKILFMPESTRGVEARNVTAMQDESCWQLVDKEVSMQETGKLKSRKNFVGMRVRKEE